MADDNNQNKITVDLNLLQTREMQLLSKFGKEFNTAVDTLKDALRDYAGQIATAADRTTVETGRSSSGSRPSQASATIGANAATGHEPYHETVRNRRAERQDEDRLQNFGPKVHRALGGGRLGQYSFADPNLNAYERGNISFGGIGEPTVKDTMRYLSALTGKFGYGMHPEGHPDEGKAFQTNRVAARASDVTGAISRGIVYGGSAATVISGMGRALSGGGNARQLGLTQLGYDPQDGIGGSSVFSSAMRHNITSSLHNRFYGMFHTGVGKDELDATQQVMLAMGVDPTAGSGTEIKDALARTMTHTGLDADTLSQLSKRTIRYGSGNEFGQLSDQIRSMSEAARMAKMNVKEFTQGVMQLADALTARTGLNQKSALKAASQFSAATGLSGEVGANILSNDVYMYGAMSAGGRGTSPRDVSPTDATMQMLTMLPGMLGARDLKDLRHRWKGNVKGPDGMTPKDTFSMLLQSPSGKQMFGGMDEQQLGHLIGANGGASLPQRIQATTDMHAMASGKHLGHARMLAVEKMLLGKADYKKFRNDPDHGGHRGESEAQQMKALENHFKKHPSKIVLDLTGPAKKLVKQINKDDPVTRNRNDNSSSSSG